jgi:cytochrome c oxidase assembly protein subunit 11
MKNTVKINPKYLIAIFFIMLGLSFLSVPLYDLFCRVTGFGGTIQKANTMPKVISNSKVDIRFDTNVGRGVPLNFSASKLTDTLKLGEVKRVTFKMVNLSNQSINVNSVFNASPTSAGIYVGKLQCFCFEQQNLKAKETKEFEMIYYIKPEILNDVATKDIKDITLSYTVFEVEKPKT